MTTEPRSALFQFLRRDIDRMLSAFGLSQDDVNRTPLGDTDEGGHDGAHASHKSPLGELLDSDAEQRGEAPMSLVSSEGGDEPGGRRESLTSRTARADLLYAEMWATPMAQVTTPRLVNGSAMSTAASRGGSSVSELVPLRVRKRPVEVWSMQFDGSRASAEAIIGWAGAEPVANVTSGITFNEIARNLEIPTLEGDHRADPGDWIIRGVAGEFYPCKPDIFDATYEIVDA